MANVMAKKKAKVKRKRNILILINNELNYIYLNYNRIKLINNKNN